MDVEALLAWYDRGHRPLPWRATRDPYALLVSEMMLQQTQAARVIPYYERWLARFPDVAALAAAPVAEVLRAWSGLGYNRRALALKAAAERVSVEGWPRDAAGLRALPGVGPYTAAAVASFAWDEPVAAVDTNVRRVLERHDGVRRAPRALAERAAELVPRRAAAFNQAMMELGAVVCTARRASCGSCPVRGGCVAAGRRGGPGTGIAGEGDVPGPPRIAHARRRRLPFEQTDRWLRGRVVAAALHGEALPPVQTEWLQRVVGDLAAEGLVSVVDGEVRPP